MDSTIHVKSICFCSRLDYLVVYPLLNGGLMSISRSLENDVEGIISKQWDARSGQKIPNTADITLSGGAVELDATFLYADLADSSKIAKELDRRVAAKILKSFLATATQLIRHNGGTIRSFDGDRVMGVFMGTFKNSSAAKCGLQINYLVQNIIRPKFENKYNSVKNASFTLSHGVGIDSGIVLTVRAGARGNNDLIFIGRAPNLAAKMSDLRSDPYHTYITETVYNKLHKSSKIGADEENMWKRCTWTFLGEKIIVYRSSYWWEP